MAFADDVDLNDPTRPNATLDDTTTQGSSSAKLSLSLIRLGPEPLAVINGKNVQPGETIAGYRLISLQPTSALLNGSNGRFVVRLAPTIRKSSSTNSLQNR
jgi:hypothetical protein